MQKMKTNLFALLILMLLSTQLFGQAIANPEAIFVKEIPDGIELDSILAGTIWDGSESALIFQLGAVPVDKNYTPTNHAVVKGNYVDSSKTIVRFAQDGSYLYISLESDDAQVCRFGDSWEGDGMFMKMPWSDGQFTEFKLYWNAAGVDPGIVVESGGKAAPVGSYTGVAVKGSTTIVNDSTNVDNGYVAVLKVSLDSLGYTSLPTSLDVLINIFDPDNYSDGVGAWGANGSFAKEWWGSEWGPDTRKLMLNDSNVDPESMHVTSVDEEMTVDGNLNEAVWSSDANYLKFKIAGAPEDNAFIPTSGWIVKTPYDDATRTNVKFAVKGMDLYIALESDDKQVCRFGDSWEGDGLFMKMPWKNGDYTEFKVYWNAAGVDQNIVVESGGKTAPVGSYSGAAVKGSTTIVNDAKNDDNGYTAELKISLDSLGYTEIPAELEVMLNIFDPDNYSDGDGAWGAVGSFGKQWWGSEWGGTYRTLTLDSPKQDPSSLTIFKVATSIVVDGQLNEPDWKEDVDFLRFGFDVLPEGTIHTPTNQIVVKGNYTDKSTTDVKFLHNGSHLYISLNSNDQQVCRFGDSWEGDGMFMKITNAAGSAVEYKIYYNAAGVDPEIVVESNGPAGSFEGMAVKGAGTVVNDSSNVDGGYTAELMINLDDLGFTNPSEVQVLINIFEPDNYSDGVGAWGVNGSFAKGWWGSEWGPDTRTLALSTETITDVENESTEVPTRFALNQNYPNPFNPTTTINYSLPQAAKVNISVYNLLGQKVVEVVNGNLSAGFHNAQLNATNLASGIYFYRINAISADGKQFIASKKMVLLK